MTAATSISAASTPAADSSQRRRLSPASLVARHPPTTAPARKAISAASERRIEKPGVPTAANPRKTTLPVMLAVNTPPSPSTLTASTRPVVIVSPINTAGSGSRGGVDGLGPGFAARSPEGAVITSSLRIATDEREVLFLQIHLVQEPVQERITDGVTLPELE